MELEQSLQPSLTQAVSSTLDHILHQVPCMAFSFEWLQALYLACTAKADLCSFSPMPCALPSPAQLLMLQT